MNCSNCNAPLDGRARFCARCGNPVAPAANNAMPNAAPPVQPTGYDEPPTVPPGRPYDQLALHLQQPQQAQPAYYPQRAVPAPAHNHELHTLNSASMPPPRLRRRTGGCLLRGLLTLIVLLLLLGAGWYFALRPYLHAMVQGKIDQAFSQAAQQIPPQLSQAPAGPVTITENVFNNLIQLTMPPDSVVKQAVVHISASEFRIDFQVFGMPCDVTTVPQVVNTRLTVTSVHVEGIIGLIMSNAEMTAILNKDLAGLQNKFNRPVQAVQLEDQKLILTLGPANGTLPSLP
jgi:hypothetical protein